VGSATLSRYTVHRILRGRLGYQGVVVSDDLLMGAIIRHYGLEEAAVAAVNAGVDVLLIAQNSTRSEPGAAERAVAAIERALADGWLSRFPGGGRTRARDSTQKPPRP